MPGYFETVIADAVRQGGTIYQLADNESPYGFKFLTLANVMLLATEPHAAGNTGPVTAGWTNFGGSGSQKTFNVTSLFPGRLPASTTSVMVQTRIAIKADATSIETNMRVTVDNNNNAILGAGLAGTGEGNASTIAGVSNTNNFVNQFIVPWNPANPTILAEVFWTNTAVALATTFCAIRIIGYNSN